MPNTDHHIVYLACPYSHPSMEVRLERFDASACAAAELIRQNMFVYSPITMTHPIDLVLAEDGASLGSDYWCDFDEAFMALCGEMIVLTLPGWKNSNGIRREIAYFEAAGKPVRYMHITSNGTYTVSASTEVAAM